MTDKPEFGTAVASILKARGLTQEALAQAAGKSQSYTNQILTGTKTASAQWADLVTTALSLSAQESAKLHAAAARDNGFKIDLPKFEA
jgi:transcriptional regulator with XRE-family HTH domain